MNKYNHKIKEHEIEFFSHFPNDISLEIQEYITNKVMDWSRYIFTHREGKKQWGYCTHCKREHPTVETLKHGKESECPHCGSACTVKGSGMGRSTLFDEAYLLWYEKSEADPNTVIARGIYATRDYTGDFKDVNTKCKVTALYRFQPGGGKMMNREYYGSYTAFHERKTIWSEATHSMKNKACYHAKHSLRKAVHGTFLQYCAWEQYDHSDYLDVIDLACRYKSIEFITKVGLRSIVVSKLTGQGTYGSINWKGQTPQKILRLTMPQIKEMRKSGAIGARTLRSFQISQKDGSNLNWHEASTLSDLIEQSNQSDLQKMTQYLSIPEIKKYLAKQIQCDVEKKRATYHSGMTILRDWRDYISECKELAMNLKRKDILFPRDLRAAHQVTSSKIKIITDERVKARIVAREQLLKEFNFEQNGMLLRPAATAEELMAEGKALNHCVGGYAKRHAEGETTIFFIRKVNEPEKPFFTMELKIEVTSRGTRYEIVQCRGKGNCGTTPIIKTFLNTFKEKKLKARAAKTKIRNKNRVEVAI